MPEGVKSKRRSQTLEASWPSTTGVRNFQRRAAVRARTEKYLLGPRASSSAADTSPAGSTWTRTLRRTLPRIVSRAFWETCGRTFCKTSPCARVDERPVASGCVRSDAAAAGGMAEVCDLAVGAAASVDKRGAGFCAAWDAGFA